MDTPLVLMDSARIRRSARRMGYEILELNSENKPITLFGIDHRGYAVAQLLAEILEEISDVDIRILQLPIKNDSDEDPFSGITDHEIRNSLSIIVDDVIYSGQTMFKALKKVTETAALGEVHTAVMIDRGHRKLPVMAEFSGMDLPTKHKEHVSVIVEDMNIKAVELEKL